MIGLHLTVPIACWRRGAARSYWETEPLPPPSTAYGALLSLVGETDRERHIGCRVTTGLVERPAVSTVLRKVWRVKTKNEPMGEGTNAVPEYQELAVGSELILWLDSADEASEPTLEQRVRGAMQEGSGARFGGWSLGESTHLINDAWLVEPNAWSRSAELFLTEDGGDLSLPIWVDHVGAAGTRRAMGRLVAMSTPPPSERIPVIRNRA